MREHEHIHLVLTLAYQNLRGSERKFIMSGYTFNATVGMEMDGHGIIIEILMDSRFFFQLAIDPPFLVR